MRLLRRWWRRLRPKAAAGRGYGAEVLFAGWVELPPGFRARPHRSATNRGRSLSAV